MCLCMLCLVRVSLPMNQRANVCVCCMRNRCWFLILPKKTRRTESVRVFSCAVAHKMCTHEKNNGCVSHLYMCIIVVDRKSAVEIEIERGRNKNAHWRWLSNRCCRTHLLIFGQFSICSPFFCTTTADADAAPQTKAFHFPLPQLFRSRYLWLVNRAFSFWLCCCCCFLLYFFHPRQLD